MRHVLSRASSYRSLTDRHITDARGGLRLAPHSRAGTFDRLRQIEPAEHF